MIKLKIFGTDRRFPWLVTMVLYLFSLEGVIISNLVEEHPERQK
jgi:hypothetical protein